MQSSNACKQSVVTKRSSATIHGLELQTPFEIWPGASTERRQWSHQVSVRLTERWDSEAPLRGSLVAESRECGQRMYAFARTGSRIEFSFPDLCFGHIDVDLGHIELCSQEPDVAALVLPNTIVAVLLGHLNALALHASAVQFRAHTVAFCGPSTAGKTTSAAALCLLGALAVTDDLLRVETDRADGPVCFPGIPEFRLRTTHDWALPNDQVRALVDERIGFTPQRVAHDKAPLRAIVFPTATTAGRAPTLRRVQGELAVRRLLQSSRIAWTPQAGVGFLRQISALAKRVELYELELELSRLSHASYLAQFAQLFEALADEHPHL